MRNQNRAEEDFKYYFERFVSTLSGNDPGYSEKFYRKVFFGVFEDTKRNLDYVVTEMRHDIEENLNRYAEEIAKEMSQEFSEVIWEKFEDGHSWYNGMKAICYFKETDKYYVGTAMPSNEGTHFLLSHGEFAEPDYVCPLYEFKGIKEEKE